MASDGRRKVAILIFDDVEVLDFAGPFEVFGIAGERSGVRHFEVFTVAESRAPVAARNGLSVNPTYAVDDCPAPDIIVVPGGIGSRRAMRNPALLDWVRRASGLAELTLSVCTGALVLGAAGLLDGLRATTHHTAIDLLREMAPRASVVEGERFVDNGRVIAAAGVSAGIDMALHVVERLLGTDVARETARQMEYEYRGAGGEATAWSPST